MKRAFLREHGKSGLELIEEAFVLLRSSPASILATYYLGSVPFVAGFLIFWADLSRHPEAPSHLGGATLAITALFIWMKFFHAKFGAMLLSRLRGDAPEAGKPAHVFRSVLQQTILQSTALFLIPIAFVAVLPSGWVYAFYQNVSVLDDGKTRLRALFQSAIRQAALWPKQNHVLLFVLSLFGFFVFLDWITIGFLVPQLLKMFFGVESVFTRSPLSILNSTFFMAAIALAYLSVDPLVKTCYTVRCFYGRSLQSGDDIRTEIRRLSGHAPALALCLLFCLTPQALPAAESVPAPTPVVAGENLDQSIGHVIQQDKYLWRSPKRTAVEKKEDGVMSDFFKSISETFEKVCKAIGDFFEKITKWLRRDRSPAQSSENPAWAVPQIGLLFIILAVVACGLAIAILRMIQARRHAAAIESTALATMPDLEDENTAADELPEDDWSKMGRQFLDQGDLRLALRAFYLASLSHLAARGLITIARAKSNRDYERELRRRGHSLPELPVLFGENVGIFDRIWYGLHEVNPDMVQRFIVNLEKIKTAA